MRETGCINSRSKPVRSLYGNGPVSRRNKSANGQQQLDKQLRSRPEYEKRVFIIRLIVMVAGRL